MIKGITVNGKHSYYGYSLRMLKHNIGSPPKDEHLERVPFSNVTYDFDEVFGKSSYGERTLTYQFELVDMNIRSAEDAVVNIINWLHWRGRVDLYDDMLPNYHFEVREPIVSYTEDHGVYKFTVTFKANPAMIPNPSKQKYNAANVVIPDVNGDGYVDALDASDILAAYRDLSTGKDPGLTPQQKLAADANRDGYINAVDASLVLNFYSKLSTGAYDGIPLEAAWAKYLNEVYSDDEGVF